MGVGWELRSTHVHPLSTSIRVSLWRDDYVHVARASLSCLGACICSIVGVQAQRIVRNRKKKAGIYSIFGPTTKRVHRISKMLIMEPPI